MDFVNTSREEISQGWMWSALANERSVRTGCDLWIGLFRPCWMGFAHHWGLNVLMLVDCRSLWDVCRLCRGRRDERKLVAIDLNAQQPWKPSFIWEQRRIYRGRWPDCVWWWIETNLRRFHEKSPDDSPVLGCFLSDEAPKAKDVYLGQKWSRLYVPCDSKRASLRSVHT